jgi:hypothetical protein
VLCELFFIFPFRQLAPPSTYLLFLWCSREKRHAFYIIPDACVSVRDGAFSGATFSPDQKVWKSNCRRSGGRSTTINHSAAQFWAQGASESEKSSQPSTPVCQTYKHKQNVCVRCRRRPLSLSPVCLCFVVCAVDAPRFIDLRHSCSTRFLGILVCPCVISIGKILLIYICAFGENPML